MVGVKIMVHLPKEFTKNGFLYILVERTPKKAIYSQWLGNDLIAYEVIKIRVHPQRYNAFLKYNEPEREIYPSKEQWGTWDGRSKPGRGHWKDSTQ